MSHLYMTHKLCRCQKWPKEGVLRVRKCLGYAHEHHCIRILVKITKESDPIGAFWPPYPLALDTPHLTKMPQCCKFLFLCHAISSHSAISNIHENSMISTDIVFIWKQSCVFNDVQCIMFQLHCWGQRQFYSSEEFHMTEMHILLYVTANQNNLEARRNLLAKHIIPAQPGEKYSFPEIDSYPAEYNVMYISRTVLLFPRNNTRTQWSKTLCTLVGLQRDIVFNQGPNVTAKEAGEGWKAYLEALSIK